MLQARDAHKTAQESRQLGHAKNAMEGALARAAAGGGAITLRKRGSQQMGGKSWTPCSLLVLQCSVGCMPSRDVDHSD